MNDTVIEVLSILTNHLVISVGGIICIVLGYKLFVAAASAQTGDGHFKIKDWAEVKLSKVAPGVFFALFGAAILAFSIFHPMTIEDKTGASSGGLTAYDIAKPNVLPPHEIKIYAPPHVHPGMVSPHVLGVEGSKPKPAQGN